MQTQLQYVCMQHIMPSNAPEIIKWGASIKTTELPKKHSNQWRCLWCGEVYYSCQRAALTTSKADADPALRCMYVCTEAQCMKCGSTETRTAKRTRRPYVHMRARVPMRLRIDDSRPPVNVAAGYKNNARKAMNYVRDRHIDRLA